MRNREIVNGVGAIGVVLSMVGGTIVCLLVVAFGGGMQSVAAVGAIGMIVTAALEFLGRRLSGRDAEQEPD